MTEQKENFTISSFQPKIAQLEASWLTLKNTIRSNRERRKLTYDVEALRNNKELEADAVLIPKRVIDVTIRREMPVYLGYLTRSQRTLIFRRANQFDAKSSAEEAILEKAFTDGLRYPNWERTFFKVLDGSLLHGWDSVEVTLDPTKPFGIAIEHVGTDNLLFPVGCRDIQQASIVLRRYQYTAAELKTFVDSYGFSESAVNTITVSSDTKVDEIFNVYKVFIKNKTDGIIYVAWYSDKSTSLWLKEPEPLFIGRYDENSDMLSETSFPVFVYRYQETEESLIVESKGRAFLDQPVQEASTAMLSSYVTSLMRSVNTYVSVDNTTIPGDMSAPKQLDLNLKPGSIWDRKVNFYNPPAASTDVLRATQVLETGQQADSGLVNFAVNNRPDSEKTATEIDAAAQQASLLSSVSVSLLSGWANVLFTFVWQIVQSRAMIDLIALVPERNGDGFTNDKNIIGGNFYTKASGDVDVILRGELIQKMGQLWPIVSKTGAAQSFLRDFLTLSLPDVADKYVADIANDTRAKQLLLTVSTMLETIVTQLPTPPTPEEQQQLLMLKQNVQEVLSGS